MVKYQRNPTKTRKTLELPTSIVFVATKMAKANGITFTSLVKELLERYIKQETTRIRKEEKKRNSEK